LTDKPNKFCVVCGKLAEGHHIRTRGAGGSDDESNILWLCRRHHVEIHTIGKYTFAKKYKIKKIAQKGGKKRGL